MWIWFVLFFVGVIVFAIAVELFFGLFCWIFMVEAKEKDMK